jgi:hypothetical protein
LNAHLRGDVSCKSSSFVFKKGIEVSSISENSKLKKVKCKQRHNIYCPLTGEGRMKRTLVMMIIGVLCLSIFFVKFASVSVSTSPATSSLSSFEATPPRMALNSYDSDPSLPGVGVGVRLYPNGSVQYVSCSDYVFVRHGWVDTNWSSLSEEVQNAFLDPAQTNFTLGTNASGFANPPLTQFTYYNGTEDAMYNFFWFQFYPSDFAPGNYSFTGTWQMAAAANPPDYTPVYEQRTVTLVVSLANSTTSVSCSPSLVSIGWPVNCTATVSGLNATGTVNWATSSSTGSFGSSNGNLSSGSCSTTYIDNGTGYVTITASYSGDANNWPSSGNTVLTVFVNTTVGVNVTVYPTSALELTFANVTAAGFVVANETPTVQAPPLPNITGQYYNIKVTATYSGYVTISLAYNDSGMSEERESSLRMMQYTPLLGDITCDGKVDMKDISLIAKAFGTKPGDARWNPNADVTGTVAGVPDGKVDMKDISLAAKNFGKTTQWTDITSNVDTTNNLIYGQTTHFSLIGIH